MGVSQRRFPMLLVVACLVATIVALLVPRKARAIEHHFAGSAQIDYLFVPTQPQAKAPHLGFDGLPADVPTAVAAAFD